MGKIWGAVLCYGGAEIESRRQGVEGKGYGMVIRPLA